MAAASSTVVIKVKYGDTLRRFNAQIVDCKIILNMDGLREKIRSLFTFSPDSDLMLTYVDEDSDAVALVDDDDLHDVVNQGLNPLRITVKVNDEKNKQYNSSSASSTPSRSPRVRPPFPNLNSGISEILSKVPEPLRDTLVKLSDDLTSKASSSPAISELVDLFSKVSLPYLSKLSETQPGAESSMTGVPESCKPATETKNSECLEQLEPESSKKRNEVKCQDADAKSKEVSSFDFNAAAAALDSQNENAPNLARKHPGLLARKHPGLYAVAHALRKKEKLINKYASLPGKGVCKPSESKVGTVSGSSNPSDAVTGGVPFAGGSNFGGPIDQYECPFSGTVMGGPSAVPLDPATEPLLSRGYTNQNNGSGNIFHRGVRCDGCGSHPIIGPRFKSKVRMHYDLCCICFEEMGNSNDYIRIDRPAALQSTCLKGLRDAARARHQFRGPKCKLQAGKLDSRFIQDVNIFDGTFMAPSTQFTKIWRMRNNGTLIWPAKTQLIWIGGDKLSNEHSVEVQIPPTGVWLEQELDIAVDMISPELPGRYISYWRMASPSGQKFGQRVWVLIQVDAKLKETPLETVRNLNLNLPPVSSGFTGPGIFSVEPEPEPVVEDSHPVADNSKKAVESGKLDVEQELKFPINDTLLVGNGASVSIHSSGASTSGSYPIVDLSDLAPLPAVSPSILFPIPPLPPPPPPPSALVGCAEQSALELPAKNEVEEQLLKELEEMGFKQVDLNKEALRMNEYDLEQAVDDLCGVAEWDPILEELQEMGFNDTEMNKKLLKKNNGSIKRVVMDLIAGEKI